MQIVMLATGTRGDLQPSLALGLALRRAGYAVRLVAGANFEPWIRQSGLECYSTLSSAEVMASEEGLRWTESSGGFSELRAMRTLSQRFAGRVTDDILGSTQGADLLIGGMIEEPYLQAVAEKHRLAQITLALQPYRPTRNAAATMMLPLRSGDSVLNRWSTLLTQRLAWTISVATTNRIRAALGLAAHSASSFFRIQRTIPALYAFSPHVVPPVSDADAYATGYCFLERNTPLPPGLVDFIQGGDAPVYVGFGSMASSDPAGTLRLVGDVLARLGRRGVVAMSAQAAPAELPAHVCLAGDVDHARLLPHMAALVHHGGAGTTAAGLRAGVPALVVPHMADQPYWGRRVHALGAGVKPIPRSRLTAARLEQQLRELLDTPRLHENAAALGRLINAEQGLENAVHWISEFVERQGQAPPLPPK